MRHIIGCAQGVGAGNAGCANAPSILAENFPNWPWLVTLEPEHLASDFDTVTHFNSKLASTVAQTDKPLLVVGGDHSIAMGTWSGALQRYGATGLIWFDAHLDFHTLGSTPSDNMHGMPLAGLTGLDKNLLPAPYINPERLVIIGARSYEDDEVQHVQELGVKVFYAKDITTENFADICSQARAIADGEGGFGVSLDIDFFDENYVPGTGTPEPGGPSTQLMQHIVPLCKDANIVEVVEFNPHLDENNKTLKMLTKWLPELGGFYE